MGVEEIGIGVSVLKDLAEISPFAVLLVLAFALFYHMHKKSIEAINDNFKESISEIRQAYKDANDHAQKQLEETTKKKKR